MRKGLWLAAVAACLAMVPMVGFAEDAESDGSGLLDRFIGPDAPVKFGGWVSAGYTSDEDGLFNTHKGVNVHQTWLYLERTTDGSEGLDIGGRFDVMHGVDGIDTQAFGNERGEWDFRDSFDQGEYGFALPQLYVELAYDDFKVKAGHFYTLLGYEVVPATGNFFFTHAFTMTKSEAFTHTGAVATYSGIEGVELYGGWTAGWDTGFDRYRGGNNFIGGVKYTPLDQLSMIYITTVGDLGWVGEGYAHSFVATVTPIDKLTYVFQSDYVDTNGDVLGHDISDDYNTVGINQYLIYQVLDRVGVGTRMEWWKASGTSYYGATFGTNLKLLANLVLRPEYRYQWSPASDNGWGDGLPMNQSIFAVDAVVSF
ncbi:MAG TPA: outer membrane beta-barrel protein [Terriglobales bacterium]|nr:outer membrane beta-barrel protein [Terriglobales bacterium]